MGAGEHDVFFQSLYGALIASMQKGQGGPFAAGVVSGGELISVGTNSVLASHDVSRHAEINALAGAGRMRKTFNLSDSILLTSHFPCLMCYHAIKWAQIKTAYYLFDYTDTEKIFGFRGDSAFLKDLSLEPGVLQADPGLELIRYRSQKTEALYRGVLVKRWNEEFKETCSGYDLD